MRPTLFHAFLIAACRFRALLVLLLLPTIPGRAEDLIAYEGFGYDPGSSVELRNGGFGWQGAWDWRRILDSKGVVVTNSAIIQRGSLRYGDLETTGHHVLLSGEITNLELGRKFASVIPGAGGTSTYLSFLARRVGPEANTSASGYPWGDNAYPRGASLRVWNTTGGEQLSVGNYSSQNLDEWALYGQDLLLHTGVSFSDSLALVVARIDHHGDESVPDDVYLWINPDLQAPEDVDSATLSVIGETLGRVEPLDYSNLLGISPFAGAGDANRPYAQMLLDEIRVGRTWASVVPTVPQWAGYRLSNSVEVDTGDFLAWLSIEQDPWLWSYPLTGWLYCREESVTAFGAWVCLTDLNAAPPGASGEGSWFGYPVREDGFVSTGSFFGPLFVEQHPWCWSVAMRKWLFVPGDPTQPAGQVWSYALDSNDLSLPLGAAVSPSPADGDWHVDDAGDRVTLEWASGTGVVSHDLYFGTDRQAVAAATRADPEFMATVAGSGYEVSGLNSLQEYYWRVDERGGEDEVVQGQVWSFRPRQLAFTGAEGYGRFALGGRGGRVYVVANLNDSGPGSLREAVEAEGPRIIVFNVGGLITLESHLSISDGRLTVAGQTAPGKGITIRKYKFGMSGAEDVVIRHLRVRPGNIAGITLDGMGMQGSDHCIIDHCSISWTIDEAFSSRSGKNITLQKTLIAEALNIAGHKNYPPGSSHGFAASIGGDVGSFHHNLLAHCAGRNWSLAGGLDAAGFHTGSLDIRNNVVYNFGYRTTDGGAQYVNFVGNYYKEGAASTERYFLDLTERNPFGPQQYFVQGNVWEENDGAITVDEANQLEGVREPDEPRENYLVQDEFFPSHITEHSAREAYKAVLSDVGMNSPVQDDQDTRIIGETLTGTTTYTGSVSGLPGQPDSQEDVGGWEDYPEVHRPAGWDSDLDGLPDWWEELFGLNPDSPAGDYSDTNGDPDGDEWTHMDEFLDWMAMPRVECLVGQSVRVDLGPLFRGYTDNPVYTVVEAVNGDTTWTTTDSLDFTPSLGAPGLAYLSVRVTDADGHSLERTIGIRVLDNL